MEYKSLNQLQTEFKKGKFEFTDSFSIQGLTYIFHKATSNPFNEYVSDEKQPTRPIITFTVSDEYADQIKEKELEQLIVFVWTLSERKALVPSTVKTIQKPSEDLVSEKEETDENHIGDVVDLYFTTFSGHKPLQGKVDTGADVSSLHVDSWEIHNKSGKVKFINKTLSTNVITAPLLDKQAVKSADSGIEYRPVIKANIRINGKLLTDVEFNLNDRSSMEYPVLIGQNVLEKGKFLINPRLNEPHDEIRESAEPWKEIQESVTDVKVEREIQIHELLEQLVELDVSFSDILKHANTEALDKLENMEY